MRYEDVVQAADETVLQLVAVVRLQTRGAVVLIAAYAHGGLDVWLYGKQRRFHFEAWPYEEVAIAILIAGCVCSAQIEPDAYGTGVQEVTECAARKALVPRCNGWVVGCVELTVDANLGFCGTVREGK